MVNPDEIRDAMRDKYEELGGLHGSFTLEYYTDNGGDPALGIPSTAAPETLTLSPHVILETPLENQIILPSTSKFQEDDRRFLVAHYLFEDVGWTPGVIKQRFLADQSRLVWSSGGSPANIERWRVVDLLPMAAFGAITTEWRVIARRVSV